MNIPSDIHELRYRWFARLLAIAVMFHIAAVPAGQFEISPLLAVLTLMVSVSASLTILFPTSRALLAMCLLVPLHAFAEAPIVGNNWILTSLVSLCVVLGMAGQRFSPVISTISQGQILWAVRATVLTGYFFAAFAKLNWDFLDPLVSCVPIFQDRLVSSLGLGSLSVLDKPAWGHGFAVMTIVVELAIPLLLLFRPTRRLGVALAAGFHGVLAFDLNQHFWDFTSILFAGFFLFLDDAQLAWIREKCTVLISKLQGNQLYNQKKRPLTNTAALFILFGIFIGLLGGLPRTAGYSESLENIGHAVWWLLGSVCMVAGIGALGAPLLQSLPDNKHSNIKQSNTIQHSKMVPMLLWLPALLALFNGLTPYLELKTGFGWNMYSNLRTVGGESNHILIPRTFDLLGAQRDVVRIVSSTDPNLQGLKERNYGLAYSQLVSYAHRFPETNLTYTWRGQTVHATRLGDDPAASVPRNLWQEKFWNYRAIDLEQKQRCQAYFTRAY